MDARAIDELKNEKESFVSNILSNKHKACLDAHKIIEMTY